MELAFMSDIVCILHGMHTPDILLQDDNILIVFPALVDNVLSGIT